jgi:type VI secretion system protein VasJ
MPSFDTFVERTASLRAPLAGENPAGKDATFEPDFEQLKGEIDKLTSMAGSPPNWRDIDKLASSILTEKAKDFRVVTWLALARMNQNSFSGFAEGLAVMRGLIDEYWTTMYPDAKRARARANLVSWLEDNSCAFFEQREVTSSDSDAVKACDELIAAIDSALAEKLADLHPGMNKLKGTFRNKVRSIPAEAPAAPPPGAAPPPQQNNYSPAPSNEASAPAPMPTPSLPSASSPDDAIAAIRECGSAIISIAKMLRRADPAQAWPYRLQRIGNWLGVQRPPPNEANKTRLPPPSADVKKKLQAMMEQQKWMELLAAAEDATADYLFWLDLHRMVAVAMDSLGALFLGSREAVGREVTSFLQRYPAITGLTFSDGSPFADAATKSWLDQEMGKWGGGGGGGSAASSAASEEDQELAKRFEEAKEMVSTGKVPEGLALAAALAVRAPDARARFRSRLAVAQLAIEGGKMEIARPILEALTGEVEQHGLETWEPVLSSQVYASLLACLQASAAAKTPEVASRQGWLFDRLCRLDPAAALKVSG